MIGSIAPLALSTAVLVIANLVPLGGALFGWWSAYDILLLFWAENVVIGLFQIARMTMVLVRRHEWELMFMIPFFCVHYGGFAFCHLLVLATVLGAGPEPDLSGAIGLLLAPSGLLPAVLVLAASHGFSFVVNFALGGEWRGVTPGALMGQPYVRVGLLHVALIAGAVLVKELGSPVPALALLVVLKIALDVVMHLREHRVAG
jgi:hypothetical protein